MDLGERIGLIAALIGAFLITFYFAWNMVLLWLFDRAERKRHKKGDHGDPNG